MEFRQFHYIRTIAREGSMSRAAQKLFVSQPSLSQLVASVEKKLGAPLFDRSTNPLQPTEIGKLYLENARHILELDEEFHQHVDDMLHLDRGIVTIGSSPFRSAYLLAPFLPRFQQAHPQIELRLREHNTLQLETMAQNGEVDAAISLDPIDHRRFESRPLFEEEVLAVLPASHPLTTACHLPDQVTDPLPAIELGELAHTPFIQISPEQKMHQIILDLCTEAGFTPDVRMSTSSMEAALALAGAGLGAALLPITQCIGRPPGPAPHFAALRTHPLRRVNIIWRRHRYLSHAARAFIESLATFCAKQDSFSGTY